ncbi:FxsB family cyclophane-forming radical SAM/SPASM peptide maturase [Acrocarpospora catenulata]|uniref:FxsB family cyclophane-forming radical SAM/SPASM peptide maturase n=1 Tax=Acrocarpospora catenulata TaxID=2836182 RepID=UPI001BDA940C|nr:FxsB family cyclophane-forming radical SAM/SPASM peptide maturase [Acrocarpospora catenulata]
MDVAEQLRRGWRPVPFRTFVLKIQSRCDLACDYCYMYESADQRWRGQPARMPEEVVARTAARIAEHARTHRLSHVEAVLHGGEPLLAGPERMERIVRTLRETIPVARLDLSVQTNAMRLDEAYLRIFHALDVRVGVSIDGDRAAQDRHRRTRGGGSSHARVSAALDLLASPPHRRLFAGLLCTVDLANDPLITYRALLGHDPPTIDFLLPHGNWTQPPPGLDPNGKTSPYADWLIPIFDEWYAEIPRRTRIRLFEEIIFLLLGRPSRTEGIGLSPSGVLTIESDGSIEQADALKTAYEGAPVTGLHVDTDPFEVATLLPSFVARQLGVEGLGPACRACSLHQVCGGGLYAHRYLRGNGFANPSVYCADLFELISHIRHRLAADVHALRRRTS